MRRNVTIGFAEQEVLRLQGAAAMARMPLATYLRWLIQGRADDSSGATLSAILQRLDDVVTAIANLPREPHPAPPPPPVVAPRELFEARMKARGIPSSTVRQVMITLDELERSA